jgi:competence ComEA-like helix-hairpin-helix protein
MKFDYEFKKSYNRSILFLSLFVTVFYVLVNYIPIRSSSEGKQSISKPVYVEIATENESSYIVELEGDEEASKLVEFYRLTRPPKNGDKLIISGESKIILSRINGKKSLALGIPIGINSATIEDLIMLPGIGPKLAEKIIEYREFNGRFKNPSELQNVNGIGEKKFKSIKRLISLD